MTKDSIEEEPDELDDYVELDAGQLTIYAAVSA
jgi:hypothetical protein